MRLLGFLIVFTVLFSSCEKQDNNKELRLVGKWLLIDGEIYMENMETAEKVIYQHFGDGKTVSSLNAFDPPNFPLERIEQNVTTWEFASNGDFILDETYLLALSVTGNYTTIVEHPGSMDPADLDLGGSARPFTGMTLDYENEIIVIRIQDTRGSKDGYNYEWYNDLVFQRISK